MGRVPGRWAPAGQDDKVKTMTRTVQTITIGLVLLLGLLFMTGCDAGLGSAGSGDTAEPTITAIPLPTRSEETVRPEETATEATASDVEPTAQLAQASPTATTAPTESPTATETPSPEPTATQPEPTPEPTETPEPTVTPVPTAKAQAAKPKPTATPEFRGKLVFQTTTGSDFYTIHADGTGLRRITDGVDPVWSPDGTRIAFTRWREPRGVWVINADGSEEWRVFDWSETRWPSWSPDGSQIMFSRQEGGRLGESEWCFRRWCFTIGPDPHWQPGFINTWDGSFNEPPSPNVVLAPDWSPDGQQFVYDGVQGLTIQTVDGEVSWQITQDARDTGPVWSPNGKRIVFTRKQHDHWEVYAVNADGSNLRRLTTTPARADDTPANSAAPAWSPDGQHIAFFTDRSGQWEIWVMNADGSDQKPMFSGELAGLSLEYTSSAERAISWTD